MPEAVAAAVVSFFSLEGAAAAVVSVIVEVAVSVAISAGINYVVTAAFGLGPSTPKPSDGQRTIKQAVAPRQVRFGRCNAGGIVFFYESKAGVLYKGTILGHASHGYPLTNLVEYRLNNKVVNVDSDGVLTDPEYISGGPFTLASAMRLQLEFGKPTDGASSLSRLGIGFSEWTSAHKLKGCAAVLLEAASVDPEDFTRVYAGGREPEVTVVGDFNRQYDPRLDSTVTGGSGSHRTDDPTTWEWTDNSALIIANYLFDPDGYGLSASDLDWENIIEEANVCDQLVTIRDGTTQIKRYRSWGFYTLGETRKQVLQRFLAACDGFVYQDGSGKAILKVGRFETPTTHITDDHILSCQSTLGVDPLNVTNKVTVLYTEPLLDYFETETAPITDGSGDQNAQRFDIFEAPHHNQASRIAKRLLRRLNPEWTHKIVTDLAGLNAIGERFINLTISELDISEEPYEITRIVFNPLLSTVEIDLVSTLSTDFDFDAPNEEGLPPTAPTDTSSDLTIPTPTGVTLAVATVDLGQTNGVSINAQWDAPPRSGLSHEARFRDITTSTWFPMVVTPQEEFATTGLLASGDTYEVQVRARSVSGLVSDWTASASTTATASNVDNVAPSAPTSLSVSVDSDDITVSWTGSSSSNRAKTEILRGTSSSLGSASVIATVFGAPNQMHDYVDTSLAADTYYYWIRDLNASDVASSEVGPQSETVT